MEPISTTGCVEANPGAYILPVAYVQLTAAGEPVLAKWWQWVEPTVATQSPRWVLVSKY
jgi:hypothetical protein